MPIVMKIRHNTETAPTTMNIFLLLSSGGSKSRSESRAKNSDEQDGSQNKEKTYYLNYLPDSTEIADIREPYIPLFGALVVPFPAQ